MMKKLCIFAALAAALLAAGCAKEKAPAPIKMVPVTMQVGVDTKTVLNGTAVNWVAGDEIIITVSGGSIYTLSAETVDGSSATFSGLIAEADLTKNVECVCYPAWENFSAWWSHPKKMPIPSEQPFVDGSFASGINPAVAFMDKTIDNPVTLINMGGLFAVKITSSIPVTKVTLTGNAEETLAGVWQVEAWAHTYETADNEIKSVSIVPDAALDLTAGKTFVFVVKPGEFPSGITLTALSADGKAATKVINKAFTLARGGKANLPDLTLADSDFETPFNPSSVDLSGTYEVIEITPTVIKSNVNGAGPMQNTVYKTAVKCDGSDANWPVPSGGQEYVVQYNRYGGQVLFFDLSTEKVPGLDGCYYLVNIQDRNITTAGQITDNHSYYDSVSGMLVFDFVREQNNSYGYQLSKPRDMSAYDLTGTYTVTAITPTTSTSSVNPAGPMQGAIYETAVKCDGTDSNWPAVSNGQKYVIQYNRYGSQVLFFDLSSVPVIGKSGCYYLSNLQDRQFTGTITNNHSYFDTTDGSIVFDFVRETTNTYGYKLTL